MKNTLIKLILLSTILVSAAAAQVYPWNLLPDDNEVSTWVRGDTSNYKVWHDESHPNTYLSDFINGGDGAYLPYGFIRGTIQNFSKGGDQATIWIFEFPNGDSALHCYNGLAKGGQSNLTGLCESARLDESGLFTSIIEGVQGNYYIYITFPKSGMDDAKNLVSASAANITENSISDLFARTDGPEQDIVISPNPAADIFSVMLRPGSIDMVEVYHMDGTPAVMPRTRDTAGFTLDGSGLAPGTYIVKIHSGPGIASATINIQR